MLSVVNICNVALSRIGISNQISSISEQSNEAVMCSLHYEHVRDRVLRDHPWPFARRLVTLALVSEDEDRQWTYWYRYPAAAIAVRRIANSIDALGHRPTPFAIGGDSAGLLVMTDQEEAVGEYTARVTDPTRFDPIFASAVGWLLASEIAMPLAVKDSLRERALQMYHLEISAATANAGNEQQPTEPPDSEFERSRL